MSRKRDKARKFKVYYFHGDYWSGQDEELDSVIIMADSESDAEQLFIKFYRGHGFSLGWIDEI